MCASRNTLDRAYKAGARPPDSPPMRVLGRPIGGGCRSRSYRRRPLYGLPAPQPEEKAILRNPTGTHRNLSSIENRP
jgi:hypothetical protein